MGIGHVSRKPKIKAAKRDEEEGQEGAAVGKEEPHTPQARLPIQ